MSQESEAPAGGDQTALPTCNIVMKGGITSGVVYPLTVVELAKKYRFAGIGGTSAGAIAAALTAAAELGRNQGGFEKLAKVAEDLPRKMRSLFQPTPRHKPLFDLLMALPQKKGALKKALGAVGAALAAFPGTALLGVLPTLLLSFLGWLWSSPALAFVAAPLALLLCLPLVFVLRLKRFLTRELPASDFGFCPGIRQPWTKDDGLIDWLADLLDDVAALPRDAQGKPAKPLTFGDLDGPYPDHPAIELQMFTTCLSTGRPHVMPWETDVFMFRPEELRQLFPGRVVDWMVENSAPSESDPSFHKLPARRDLPVVVPVRMSLSFPFLFSTVPLWMRDFTFRNPVEKEKPRRLRFADGGMCSNLPLQLFDLLWPKCPTFAVTLDKLNPARHRAAEGAEERVKLPSHAGSGLLLPVEPIDSLGAFLGSMMGTMQNWQDRLQATLPGYRERIIHVRLNEDEGGLNLDMDPQVIASLADLGRQAGVELVTEFDWPAHRWTRTLTSLHRLCGALGALDAETVAFLEGRIPSDTPHAQTERWHREAVQALRALQAVNSQALAPKPPKPLPQLRMMPRP